MALPKKKMPLIIVDILLTSTFLITPVSIKAKKKKRRLVFTYFGFYRLQFIKYRLNANLLVRILFAFRDSRGCISIFPTKAHSVTKCKVCHESIHKAGPKKD